MPHRTSAPARRRGTFLIALACLPLAIATLAAQPALDAAGVALRTRDALLAMDRYLETWNSRDGALWATSLHYPHVRPGAGPFEVSRSAEEYAAGVNFAQTLRTGWHHTEWVSRDVLQVGVDKVHVAGTWQRYDAEGHAQATSAITYVVTDIQRSLGRAGAVCRGRREGLFLVPLRNRAWKVHARSMMGT